MPVVVGCRSIVTVEHILASVAKHFDLEADTERELLEEIRAHLSDTVAAARSRGMDEEAALDEAASRFGIEDTGSELQGTHAGWGTADGVLAAALPVTSALILRWLVFSPDGTVTGWQEALLRPAFWVVSVAALLVPVLRFPRWRHALASWAVFWLLSMVFFNWPAARW